MPMHQAVPTILLDVEILTVNRREAGKNLIPNAAEVLIRLLHLEMARRRARKVRNALKRCAEIDDSIDWPAIASPYAGGNGRNLVP